MLARTVRAWARTLVAGVAPGTAAADAGISAQEALAAEDARYAAQMAADVPALQRLLADDLVYVHSSTSVDDKASFIESLRSGAVRYRTMARSDLVVRTWGSVAVVTGRARFGVSVRGNDLELNLLFHAVYAKGAHGVQFVSWQATRLPA